MKRKNYKKAFNICCRYKPFWENLTDKEKKEFFKQLNEETGFDYYLEDYKGVVKLLK